MDNSSSTKLRRWEVWQRQDGTKGSIDIDPVDAVDTNGAGDTLAAVFASGVLLDGRPTAEAADRAQRAARRTCSQRVPKLHFATRDELDGG